MYYNYTDEEKYFLSITDAMLKDDYSVEEILEFWNCDDEEQVEGILSSLILTESVDLGNPELLIICERYGLGAIGGWLAKQATKLKGLFSRSGGSTRQLSIPGMNQGSGIRGLGSKIKNSPAGKKVTKAAKSVKNKLNTPLVKGAAITTGAGLALIGGKTVLDNITGSGNDSTTNGNSSGDPGVDAPTTPVVKPRRNWGYDKYKSSKKYYDNIRNKN